MKWYFPVLLFFLSCQQTKTPSTSKVAHMGGFTSSKELDMIVQEYKLEEETNDDDQVEELLQLQITGEPTKKDLNELVDMFTDPHYDSLAFRKRDQLPIDYIVVLPRTYRNLVDWLGLAKKEEKEMRLFSGYILKRGVYRHELTHFSTWIPSFIDYDREEQWKEVAGEYNKVVTKPGKGVELVIAYKDEQDADRPRFGYATRYGGKNCDEDIATHVEIIATKPELYKQVQEFFGIYFQKFHLLHQWEFITAQEYERALGYLEEAANHELQNKIK